MVARQISQIVATEIGDLTSTASQLAADASNSGGALGPSRIEELSSVASRAGQLVLRLYGRESHYHQSLQKVLAAPAFTVMHSNHYAHVSELAGILKSVQHDVSSGLISSLRGLIQAEIFADFLEMAEHLLREGYKDPAAVLLGAVLEDSLRKVAEQVAVSTTNQSGKPLTIDPLNVALTKAGTYGPLVQNRSHRGRT